MKEGRKCIKQGGNMQHDLGPSSRRGSHTSAHRNGLSDDVLDGIAAVVLILLFVGGVVYWLNSL